jgi:hypothetical protein
MRMTGSPGVQLPELHEALVRWLAAHSADPHPERSSSRRRRCFPPKARRSAGNG